MKTRARKIILINAVPSFLIALLLSMFLAQGGIAENYSGETFVFPQAFIILGTWFLGLVIGLLTQNIVLSVPIMYGSFVPIYVYFLFF
ncbi:hypothetical protein MM326_18960 [Alkalihalobacillus sp. LMS6]|uniref:hypothetical protein n=1 Tax=Alkalihalobacillus sp. LMS6 TaxID=2924034 RepID=UPI0020D04E52|nr:hypothetical protein [Alkalihalobacillus sp. LMS6]UTR06131.1 hypothetical protein MM326_18960 [Alkalihalobacillus sp. LMS6]